MVNRRTAFVTSLARVVQRSRVSRSPLLHSRSTWATGGLVRANSGIAYNSVLSTESAAPVSNVSMVTAAPPLQKRAIGDIVSGFELQREEYVQEIASVVRIWQHSKTRTELVSVSNDDENKTFGVVFRTPPNDSTGVPHILEHSVLCGSRKYPVKEPFVELMKSSLQTFLNAFTYPDKTCYPVASCNERDFYNLVDVYMDAVFHPTLTPDTLAQEGHHLELDKLGDDVSIKGVVYNEMKGAYSSSDRVLSELSMRVLFPDTTYGVESGGHPHSIPDLTWEQFKGFYDDYYHPSNARMWFYGDDAEEKRLAKANSFLSEFDRKVVDSVVGLQKPWTEPKKFEFTYDAGAGDLERKVMATVNWLINPPLDQMNKEDLLTLSVLNHILLATSASPLRKALTDSGLGDDVVGGGLEMDLRQMTFSVGLKGMTTDAVEKMQKVVDDVLRDIEKNGIPTPMIEASLNTIEFRLRENNTGSFPKGLSLMLRSMTTWLHDADPLDPLKFEEPIAGLKSRLAQNNPVFQDCVSKYILQNPHRALVVMKPDPEFSKKEDEKEKKRIQDSVKTFTEDDFKRIVSETQRLKAQQAAPDDPALLAKIPTLTRADLEKKVKHVPYNRFDDKGVMFVHHPQSTNGVVYVDLALDMSNVPTELLPLMSVLGSSLTEIGTKNQDFVTLQQQVGRETGGIRTSTYLSQVCSEDGKGPAVSRLLIRGKGMVSQVPSLMNIIANILNDVDVNNKDRIRQILVEERANLESGMAGSGHTIASSRLGAMYRPSLWADEQMGGVSFFKAVKQLIARVDNDWASVRNDLEKLQKASMSRENLMLNVTTSNDDFKTVKPTLLSFLDRLPEKAGGSKASWITNPALIPRVNEGLIVPSAVNYVAQAGNLLDAGVKLNGSHSLIAKHLGTSYLWDKIRVQGGAYGGFCRLDSRTGMFTYLSYRDPNVKSTVDGYNGAAQFLRNINLSDDELTKSVIGMIGRLDSYQLPDAKGFGSALRLLTNETDELRQQKRDELLGASNRDFRMFADALDKIRDQGNIVVVGGKDALESARDGGLQLELETVI